MKYSFYFDTVLGLRYCFLTFLIIGTGYRRTFVLAKVGKSQKYTYTYSRKYIFHVTIADILKS